MIVQRPTLKAPLILIISLLGISNACASAEEDFNRWENSLAPLYLWAQSLSGTMTQGPATAPLEIDFSDAISDLEATYTIHYEGAKGNFGVLLDYSFLNLAPSAELEGTSRSIDVDMKNTIAEVAGIYRFGPKNPWQLLLGYRSYDLDVTVKDLPSPPLPSNKITIKETIEDFFIGGRYITRMTDRWTFTGRLDVGTGDSDIVWNASAALDYKFNDVISGLIGWRILDYDVDQGSGRDTFKYDMRHSGPLFALAFRW